jgi:hypothetical protein
MATGKGPAKVLVSSFKGLGISAAQVRHFLPDWWDDEAALDENGLLELQLLLARRLNVVFDSLRTSVPKPTFLPATRRFKTIHPEGSSQLAVAASVGHGLALVLASACKTETLADVLSAQALRAQVLKTRRTVTLDSLCRWLWSHGIPVVHITNWPNHLRRPDAMCVRVESRIVILVLRKEVAPARLTYLVAHEVGHVMLGHLQATNSAVLVDDALPIDAQDVAKDDDEFAADSFAMELLGGQALLNTCSALSPQYTDEIKLVVAALERSKNSELDPGQIILGWARLTGNWPMAALAMRYLMTTQAAPEVINDVAKSYIDLAAIASDGQDHIARLTGISLDDE